MKTTKRILMLLVIASMTTILGCAKDGKDGLPGPQGPAGQNGNANVKNYSLTVSSWQWTYDNLYERHYYRYSNSSNSQSVVYGYVMSGSGKQAIPYYTCPSWQCIQFDMATYLFGSPPYIEFQYTNYNSKTTAPTSDSYFYLVIVPPTIRMANPNVDWTNYEEVKKTFNLGEPIHIESSL